MDYIAANSMNIMNNEGEGQEREGEVCFMIILVVY
jgi:hypothetical protein